jgi:UPF0755 protein
MKKSLKIALLIFGVVLIIGLLYGYSVYRDIFKSNVSTEGYVYIPTNATFDEFTDSLKTSGLIDDFKSFKQTASIKKFNDQVYPGRYKLSSGMTNNQLVNMFRSGKQAPIHLTFNNIRTKEELAGKISIFIEADSMSISDLLNDESYISKFGFNKRNIISMFIPNTYEIYWNTSAKNFIDRMNKEYNTFWNDERKKKAETINLSQQEVSILASIVQAEQRAHNDEKPRVAGLYINRLERDMLLQSDPTLIYASGDFTKKRVLNRDKEIESPYNTYKYPGLPPGPINMPEISSIDAVLNYEEHNYIFMCAKEDFSGYHNFSTNARQHGIYARKYQQALNKRKIWK